MRLPRWAHHAYASTRGYFWAPCPHCGRYFGGHEIVPSPRGSRFTHGGPNRRRILCPICTRQGVPWPPA